MAQESTSAKGRIQDATQGLEGTTALLGGYSWNLPEENGEAHNNNRWGVFHNLWENIEDYFTGKHSQKRQYDYDMLKLQEQERFEKEMWEKSNAYNSTPQQLARWRTAGGNPNAFFGGGTNTGNASSVSAPAGGAGVGSTIGTLQGAVGQTADAIKTWWDARKAKADAEGREIENGTLRQLNEATIAEIKARTDKAVKEGKLSEANAKSILEMLPLQKNKTSAEIDKMKEEVNTMLEQQKQIQAMTRNLKADTRKKVEERRKLEWERTFRDTFGVDPNSGPIQMLIQNILSGKGANVLQTFFNYLEGLEDEGTDQIKNYKPKTLNGHLLHGVLQAIYDGYKLKYTKKKDWKNRNK